VPAGGIVENVERVLVHLSVSFLFLDVPTFSCRFSSRVGGRKNWARGLFQRREFKKSPFRARSWHRRWHGAQAKGRESLAAGRLPRVYRLL
jgi:hypothetical protein